MARPKLTFEQRQEYEELLSKVTEDDELLCNLVAEYIAVKAERDRRTGHGRFEHCASGPVQPW
jgi:hypothetical protein